MRALFSLGFAALLLAGTAGFDWPGGAARAVRALTDASTSRERRDALNALLDRDEPFDLGPVQAAFANSDPGVRADALAVLARRGAAASVLERALADAAVEVRVAALGAIARGAAAPKGALARARNDPEAAVRAASLTALAQRGDASGADLASLTSALRDPALEVRVAAVRALAPCDEPTARAALVRAFDDALPELRVELLDAIARERRPDSVGLFELALTDSDEQVVLAGLRGFARLGLPASEPVQRLQSAPSPAIARAATRLTERPSAEQRATAARERWLAPLERTVEARTPEQHAALLEELERTVPEGETLAADPLLEWLGRAPRALRPRIAALVERAGGPVHAPFVQRALHEAAPPLRALLLRLLARAPAGSHLPEVRSALASPHAAVQRAAIATAARTLDSASARELAHDLPRASASLRAALVEVFAYGLTESLALDRETVRILVRELARELEAEPKRAALAVFALGFLDHEAGRAHVRDALREAPRSRKIAALRASAGDASGEARALRAAARRDRDAYVAATAVIAAAQARDPSAPAAIDGYGRMPWPLGPAHAFADELAPEALCALLDSEEPLVRANALARLAHHPESACVDERADALFAATQPWPLRFAAAHWLRARTRGAPSPALARLLERCGQADPDARVRSICIGREITSEPAAPATVPRALVLADGRVLIAVPDAAGNVNYRGVRAIASVSAWLGPYGKE